MFDAFLLVVSVASVLGAMGSLVAVYKVQKDLSLMRKTLASKYDDLPPSPDVEDPEGGNTVAIVDEDEGDS